MRDSDFVKQGAMLPPQVIHHVYHGPRKKRAGTLTAKQLATMVPQLVVHVHRKPKKRAGKPAAEPCGMLTAAEAAALLGVSAKLVYRLFHRGDLEGCKVAGAVRIHRASVDAYLTSHSNRKPAAPVEVPAPQPTPRTKRRRRSPRSEGFVHLRPQQ